MREHTKKFTKCVQYTITVRAARTSVQVTITDVFSARSLPKR